MDRCECSGASEGCGERSVEPGVLEQLIPIIAELQACMNVLKKKGYLKNRDIVAEFKAMQKRNERAKNEDQ